jgi:hypothetical protein
MKTHLAEMGLIGVIDGPKTKKLIAFTFSREYQSETPHFNLGPSENTVWIKVEIPPEEPNNLDDFDILMDRKHIVNNKLKKTILEWLKKIDKRGLSNYEKAFALWNAAVEVEPYIKRKLI